MICNSFVSYETRYCSFTWNELSDKHTKKPDCCQVFLCVCRGAGNRPVVTKLVNSLSATGHTSLVRKLTSFRCSIPDGSKIVCFLSPTYEKTARWLFFHMSGSRESNITCSVPDADIFLRSTRKISRISFDSLATNTKIPAKRLVF